MLLKLAFVALNFGYLEYALLVLDAAEQAKPDRALSARLMSRDCYRLLDGLRRVAQAERWSESVAVLPTPSVASTE